MWVDFYHFHFSSSIDDGRAGLVSGEEPFGAPPSSQSLTATSDGRSGRFLQMVGSFLTQEGPPNRWSAGPTPSAQSGHRGAIDRHVAARWSGAPHL